MFANGLEGLKRNLTAERFWNFEEAACSILPKRQEPPAILDAVTADATAPPFAAQKNIHNTSIAVDRSALRRVLMNGIEEHVHFGKAFQSYTETEDGITVKFADGEEVHGCALVAADGTWSKVRHQLLPGVRLGDSEGRLIFGKTDVTEEFLAKYNKSCGEQPGLFRTEGAYCLTEPMHFKHDAPHAPEKEYVYWVLFLRKDHPAIGSRDPHHMDSEETVALVRKVTAEWHPSLRPLFEHANAGQESWLQVVSALPPLLHKDLGSSRITLMGDAIHAMSPTSGLGATTALRDSGVLMRLIEEKGVDKIVECFRVYEKEMREYAADACREGQRNAADLFGMKPLDQFPLVTEHR